MASCHSSNNRGQQRWRRQHRRRYGQEPERLLTIALAGNANVGKSVLFNRLTGSHQTIGNWPGKTVEKAEGILSLNGHRAQLVDLPGIYSLSTFSMEEIITREYIAREKPDVIINVVGAPVLERNLFFTLQLMEMGVPMVVCLNQTDLAESEGKHIDAARLESILGVPVVATVASKGLGLAELIDRAVAVARDRSLPRERVVKFTNGLESSVEQLAELVEKEAYPGFTPRWMAIKLLEDDPEIKKEVAARSPDIAAAARALTGDIEQSKRQSAFAVITADRYNYAAEIAREVEKRAAVKTSLAERLDRWTTHKVFGYLTSFLVIAGLLLWTFSVGTFLSGVLSGFLSFFEPLDPKLSGSLLAILWNGAFGGLVAGVTLVVPYVIPFYFVMALIEDSGILTRVAFMFDNFMHRIGLHGKAIIPLILGYGCNVPAIYTCRVMGTRREKMLAALAITLVPCTARTIVVLGLVAAFVGIQWALLLYVVDILLILAIGRIALKVVPGKSTGLIMEMHPLRVPSPGIVVKQTWARTRSIIYTVFPIYLIGGAAVQALYALGLLNAVNTLMSPVTVGLLGLPVIAGVLLIFGLVRKELIVLALLPLYGSADFTLFMTPAQLAVLALIGMLYFPCLATFTTLIKEFNWRTAAAISAANLAAALALGGVAARLLAVF